MTETSEQPASTQRRIGARSIAALIALILGLGLLPIGTVTYWGNRTVTDSERYIETMGPLAYSEQIQDSLSCLLYTSDAADE